MEKQDVVGLLPWLLNDSLEPEERLAVVAQLREHPDLREELSETLAALELFGQHLSTETLVDFVFDLPRDDRARIEEHLAACRDCADHAELVRASRSFEDRDVPPNRDSHSKEESNPKDDCGGELLSFSKPTVPAYWRVATVAASLVAVLSLVGWLSSLGGPAETIATRPVPGPETVGSSVPVGWNVVASVKLQPSNMTLRGAKPEKEVILRSYIGYVALDLYVPDLERETTWAWAIENEEGEPFLISDAMEVPPNSGKPQTHLMVLVPADRLAPGTFEVVLYFGTALDESSGRYRFRVGED